MKGLAIRGYDRRGGLLGYALKVMACMPDKFLVKHGLKQVYKYQHKQTKYLCNFMGKAVFHNAIYKKEWFIPTEYVNFETVKLKAPVHLHEFLTERFGDYMIPPTQDRIKWEQHVQFWNTESGYQYVLDDEWKLI